MFTEFEFFPLVFKPIIDDFAKDPFFPTGNSKVHKSKGRTPFLVYVYLALKYKLDRFKNTK